MKKMSMFNQIKDIPAGEMLLMSNKKLNDLEHSFALEKGALLTKKAKLEKEMRQNSLGLKWVQGARRAKAIKGGKNG